VLNIGQIVSSIGSSIGTGWTSQQDKLLRNCSLLVCKALLPALAKREFYH
jgi:hypothetical protein